MLHAAMTRCDCVVAAAIAHRRCHCRRRRRRRGDNIYVYDICSKL
jgi:hypothetical protein